MSTVMDAWDYAIIILAFGYALRLVLTPLFDYLALRLNGQRGFSGKEQKSLSESEKTYNKNTSDLSQNIEHEEGCNK